MVKQKLTSKEEERIKEQLKQFIKSRTLPDILRRAILMNHWLPDKYKIYISKGDVDDQEHFILAEDAIKNLEDNNMTDIDKLAIERLLTVPKIVQRIDYDYRGLVTKVKNSMVEGTEDLPDEKERLHNKPEVLDLFGSKVKPMKGFNAQPIITVGEGSKFGVLEPEKDGTNKNENEKEGALKDENEGVLANDNTSEESHPANITVRRRDAENSTGTTTTTATAEQAGTRDNGIEFGDEDY